MYEFTTECYLRVAERLVDAIGRQPYYNGAIVLYDGEVRLQLSCSLLVSYAPRAEPEYTFPHITRIKPVWWEMESTIGQDSIENDFSFGQLLNLIF